jgi:hypothetical protein
MERREMICNQKQNTCNAVKKDAAIYAFWAGMIDAISPLNAEVSRRYVCSKI